MKNFDQILGDALLDEEVAGPDLHGLDHQGVGALPRKDDETRVREPGDDRFEIGEGALRLMIDVHENGRGSARFESQRELREIPANATSRERAVGQQGVRYGRDRRALLGDEENLVGVKNWVRVQHILCR